MTTTAKIAAKGCTSTGITEQLAETLHNSLGRKVLAVVELVSEARSEKRSGDESVVLSILTIEPAPNAATEDHLRELARSFHYERQLASGQPTLDGDDIEPKVADVLAAGAQHKPHPYIASTLSTDDNAICDVCGQHEGAGVHAERKGLDDPFAIPADEDQGDDGDPDNADPDDPAYDAHPFDDGGEESPTCDVCGQTEDAAVHQDE